MGKGKGRHQSWICPFCGEGDVGVRKKYEEVIRLNNGRSGDMNEDRGREELSFIRVYKCQNLDCGFTFETAEVIIFRG